MSLYMACDLTEIDLERGLVPLVSKKTGTNRNRETLDIDSIPS